MDLKFSSLIDQLPKKFEQLMQCQPHTGATRLPILVPKCAVYLFSEGNDHLYVGRTNRLRARHREHWAGKQNDAPFAFKLARYDSGYLTKGKPTRSQLMNLDDFKPAFEKSLGRVAAMQFRWVEEVDPNRQCLLEIYATVALNAKFNDFINH